MKVQIPRNITNEQARTLLELFSVLIDSLITFYSAMEQEYTTWFEYEAHDLETQAGNPPWDDDIPW